MRIEDDHDEDDEEVIDFADVEEGVEEAEVGEGLEEDAVCEVCKDGEALIDDMIVACDGCNVAVHQSCYGIPEIPEGDWFCAR